MEDKHGRQNGETNMKKKTDNQNGKPNRKCKADEKKIKGQFFFEKKKKQQKKNENSTNQIAVILSRNRNFANQVNNEILVP